MRKRSLVVAILFYPMLAGCQQEYLRGYAAGMNHSDEIWRQSRRMDDLEERDELFDVKAKLKICEGSLAIYKAGKR